MTQLCKAIHKSAQILVEKVSIMEGRQSNSGGEANDSLRAVQRFAWAGSSSLSAKSMAEVARIFNDGNKPSYYEFFLAKT